MTRWRGLLAGGLGVGAICVLAGWGSVATDEGEDSGGDAVKALESSDFRFCHEPEAGQGYDRQWCEMLEHAPPDRCPGWKETCEAGIVETPSRGCERGGWQPEAPTVPAEPVAPSPQMPQYSCSCGQMPDLSFLAFLAELAKWLLALLVVLLVVGIGLGVARMLAKWLGSRAPAEPVIGLERAAAAVAEPDAEAVPEGPSGDLLEAARRALAEGKTAEAVLLARGAALRKLGEVGRIRIHKAATDREYVRSVRQEGEIVGPLREVVRAVEWLRWGGQVPARDEAARVVGAAERVLAVIATALVAFLLLGAPETARAQSDDYDTNGTAALLPLYEAWGFDASWRLRGLRDLDAETHVLVLDTDTITVDDEDWKAIRAWVELGGVLVVAGPADGIPEVGRVHLTGAVTVVATSTEMRARGLASPVWPGGPRWTFDGGTGHAWVVAEPASDGRVLVEALSLGAGGVLAIADSRVLWNGALVAPQNEAFVGGSPWVGSAQGLWKLEGRPRLEIATVGAIEETNQSPCSSLSNARLLAFVVQMMAVLGIAAVARGWPFAPLRDPPAEGRRAFAEHAEALGERYHRLGASRRALAFQADLALQRIGPAGLVAAAERAGRTHEQAVAFVKELTDLVASPEGSDTARDLTLMEDLWKIQRGR